MLHIVPITVSTRGIIALNALLKCLCVYAAHVQCALCVWGMANKGGQDERQNTRNMSKKKNANEK